MTSSSSSFGKRGNLLHGIKKSAKNIVWFLAQNSFLFILIFVLLEVLLAEILFYQYVSLPKVKDPEITQLPVRFKKEVYQSVLDNWKKRDESFADTKSDSYPNPFQ